ncbi:MAG: 4Fe-4S binding protein [Desulfobulbaceae bacterium]|uniref:4Fe-4S binding protein n=1 Tax=Candidatus Desulfobia pelagia TaxID=2841692 RepID=A0A8J6NDC9_9BACT|nr:4Fe-4S binding protein [Candidatus Desulfobia pelagia]
MELGRKWVQLVIAFLTNGYWGFPVSRTIYQGPLKVVCSPGLNCYSCPAATTYCPMGALQQLMVSIRFSLETGHYYVGLYVLGCIGVVGSFLGRMVCGWACPFGFIQEMLHKIPSRKWGVPRILRFFKYAVLFGMVLLLPLFVVSEFGLGEPWFCKYLCPAGTLEAGIPMLFLRPELRGTIGWLFYNKLIIMIFFIIWSVLASRPFCRVGCPLGAFYALFSRVKLVKLQLDEAKCTQCEACHHVCPMGVKFNESPNDAECISCMACMNKACRFDAISLSVAGIPLRTTEVVKAKRAEG